LSPILERNAPRPCNLCGALASKPLLLFFLVPKLRILSDLHRVFDRFLPDPVEADVVVLAGDISTGTKGLDWARKVFPHTPIVYVAGNHEYYGEAIPHLTDKLRRRARDLDISFLENEGCIHHGLRFLGCTLWTDLALFGRPDDGANAVLGMADFRAIRVSPAFGRLRPMDTTVWHRRSVTWLSEEMPRSELPTVVVTHHAPSASSLAPRYRHDPASAGYASVLDGLVERLGALLWIHGHTHHSVDYQIGTTRILSNQKGYPDEPSTGFDPDLTIV
jgi:predicted phosphodiesterase